MVELPRKIPVNPPEMNKLTKPIANKVAGVKRMLPRQIVVSQLNTLIAEGTAINKVNNTNTDPRNGFNPVTNIWCDQTRKARIAIANKEPTIARYPKMGFLDMIKNFFKNILLGGFILKVLDWFQNEENQKKG